MTATWQAGRHTPGLLERDSLLREHQQVHAAVAIEVTRAGAGGVPVEFDDFRTVEVERGGVRDGGRGEEAEKNGAHGD